MASGDDLLKAWLSAFLGGEEHLRWELSNAQSGVTREHEGGEETVKPAPDYGAVAAVTDKRVLFLVGGAADDGRDHVASVPHEEVAGVAAVEGLLTSTFVLTTGAGATWRFTARESDDLQEATAYLGDRIPGSDHVTRVLAEAEDCRNAAASADDVDTAASLYDDAIAAYRRAVQLRTSPAVDADVSADELRETVITTIEAGIAAHLDRARDRRSRGNWEYQAGDEATAYRHLSRSLDAFERAHELACECPPGNSEAIGAEREDLLAKLDSLDIRTPVLSAEDD